MNRLKWIRELLVFTGFGSDCSEKYNLKLLTTYTFLNIYFSAFKGPVRSESNPGNKDPQDSQLFYESGINNKGTCIENTYLI